MLGAVCQCTVCQSDVVVVVVVVSVCQCVCVSSVSLVVPLVHGV